jgi:biotin transport system substrate-specific component
MTIAMPRLLRVPPLERGLTLGDFLVPIRLGDRISSRFRHVILLIAGALLIALTANVAIRVPGTPVPITGQTFSVLLVGGALGFRRGSLATLLYLVLGLFLPVYAEHRSGLENIGTLQDGQLVLGATGGYLVGFVLASALVGRLAELGWDRRFLGSVAAMALGNVVIYAVGVPWLAIALGMSTSKALAAGLVPFVVGDVIKLLLAGALLPVGWWLVARRPSDR